MSYFHQDWYARFYGTEANERFRIVIGFTYGAHNNGVSRQLEGQPKEVFAICGYRLNPSTCLPTWDALVPIHEFNHSFVNSLLDDASNTRHLTITIPRWPAASASILKMKLDGFRGP